MPPRTPAPLPSASANSSPPTWSGGTTEAGRCGVVRRLAVSTAPHEQRQAPVGTKGDAHHGSRLVARNWVEAEHAHQGRQDDDGLGQSERSANADAWSRPERKVGVTGACPNRFRSEPGGLE